MRWSISRKLGLASGLMALLALVIGGFNLWQLLIIGAVAEDVAQLEQQQVASVALLAGEHRLVAALERAIATRNPLWVSTELPVAMGTIQYYMGILQDASDQETEQTELLADMQKVYETLQGAVAEADRLIREERWLEAGVVLREKVRPASTELALYTRRQVLYAQEQAAAAQERFRASARRVTVIAMLLLTAGAAVALGWRQFVFRQMGDSIALLRRGVARISSGDLSYRLYIRTGDEIEELGNEFNKMAAKLKEMVDTLEQRVAQRTQELERRALQLATAAEVAREAAAIRDVGDLLERVVHLISDRFGFYHVGIFLVDDLKEYAVLRAASSEGGQRMLERGHRLKIGEEGIVGWVAGTGQPRIALDVGEDAVYFDNPDLPATHSEIALPLKVRGEIIGVLDVQSEEPAAFGEEDVAVLQAMADQIALAIENARLLEESRRALEELRAAYGKHVRTIWRGIGKPPAFEYDRVEVRPVESMPDPLIERASVEADVVTVDDPNIGRTALVAPLRLQDRVIGVLAVEERNSLHPWTDDEIALMEAVSEQVVLALENAQLYAEAQKRAAEQEALARVAALAGSTLDLNELLSNLVSETRRIVDAEIAVLLLVDEEANALVTQYVSTTDEATLPKEWAIPLDTPGMEVSIFARGGVYYSNLGVDDPNVIPAYRPYMERLGVRNFCGVALRVREQSIGELYVINRAAGFGRNEVRLLRALSGYAANAIENARLFEAIQEERERLMTLYEVSRRLGESSTLEEAATATLEISPYVGAQHADLILFDVRGRPFLRSSVPERADYTPEQAEEYIRQVAAHGLQAWVRAHRRTALVTDTRTDPRWLILPGHEEHDPVRSVVCAPLLDRRGQVMGTLSYTHSEPGKFSGEEQRLIEEIATRVAVTLENTRLFAETQQRLQELAMLFETSRRLSGAPLATEEIAEIVARQFVEVLKVPEASVSLLDPNTRTMHIVADFYLEEKGDHRKGADMRSFLLDDYPATAQVIETFQPLVIQADDPDADPAELAYAREHNVQTLAIFPLTVKGHAIGVVELESWDGKRIYSQEELNLAMTLANQAAVAMENARLFEETRLHAEELAVLNELAQRLTARLDIEEVLEEAYHGAARLLDVTNFYIALYDPDSEIISFPLVVEDGRRVRWRARSARNGLSEYVIRVREPVLITEDLPERLAEMGVERIGRVALSWLGVPLILGDRALGVMAIQSYTTPRAYDEHDRDLLAAIAGQTAIAIQNANLFKETRAALKETEELYQAIAELNAAQTYPDILAALRRHTVLGQADRNLTIDLFDRPWTPEQMPEWVEVQARWIAPVDTNLPSRYPMQEFPSASDGLRPDRPTLITDIVTDPRVGERARSLFLQGFQARCVIFVPLVVGGQWIGYINGMYSQPFDFSEEEVRRLMSLAGQAAVAVQSIRRLEETRRALAEAEALYRAARAINEATSIEGVVRGAAEIARPLGFDACSIVVATLTDADGVATHGDIYSALATEGGWQILPPLRSFPVSDRTAARRLLNEPDFVVIHPDIEDPAANVPDEVRETARAMGIRGMVVAGLSVSGRPLGFLTFASQRPISDLSKANIHRLRTVADQVAVTLENRRLLEEATRRATQLATAAEVSAAASSILELEELLPQAVELIRARFDLYYAGIFLLDDTGRWAVLRAGTGEAGRKMLEQGHKLEVGGRSMIGWCTAHGEARIALDVGEEAVRFDNPLLPDTHSEMALPLISRGRVIGAMTIQSDKTAAFSDEDITALQAMADQLATAIENARLYAEAQRRARREQLAREITAKVWASTDLEEVLKTAARELSKALGTSHALVRLGTPVQVDD